MDVHSLIQVSNPAHNLEQLRSIILDLSLPLICIPHFFFLLSHNPNNLLLLPFLRLFSLRPLFVLSDSLFVLPSDW